jgi:DNA segregation ATPase FtsK/SpoIIIE, S-DNA-T family
MLFEIFTSSVMGSLALKAYLSKNGVGNDSKKLNKIFALSGLNVKDGKQTLTTQLLKKKNCDWGTEYRYRKPLGRSFEDYVAKQKTIEAGINTRSVKLEMKDLRELKIDRNILSNIRSLYNRKLTDRKEVELSDDGVLVVRVYDNPLLTKKDWNKDSIKPNTWSVLLGFDRTKSIYHDFDKRKHLLIAGATGYGKSVIMKSIITSLLLSKPNDISFSLVDLKGGPAFARFKDVKQVTNFGVSTNDAYSILKDVQKKMDNDYKKIVDAGYEDVTEARIKKRHFLIIDEAADLAEEKECMELLTDIVRKGRGAGYYVIYATQYPSAQAIPMQIKRNIPARLCFVLDSATASMTVLDGAGADKLPEIPGRGIYKNVKQQIIQTPYIENKLIKELITPYIINKRGKGNETKRETRENTVVFEKTGLS